MGIGIIHQELNMMDHLTVAQNIFIGRESTRGKASSWTSASRTGAPRSCSSA